MSLFYKYRWELIPLLSIPAARLASKSVTGILDAGVQRAHIEESVLLVVTALALLLLMPRVRREGRPLLGALWLVLLLPTVVGSAFRLPVELALALDLVGNPRQLGLLFIPGGIATLALTVWGMRFAMLVPAAYLATGSLTVIVPSVGIHIRPGDLTWIIVQLLVLPLDAAAIAAVAYAFHNGMSISAKRLKQLVMLLLVLTIASAVASQLQFVIGSALHDGLVDAFGMSLMLGALQAVPIAVTLGLVWLFSRGRVRTAPA